MEYKLNRNNYDEQSPLKEKRTQRFMDKLGEFSGPIETFYKLQRNYDKINRKIKQLDKKRGEIKMSKKDYGLSGLNANTKQKKHYGILRIITAKDKHLAIKIETIKQ